MKKKVMITASILILALSLTSCGVKDKAIKEIKGVDIKAYMQEDQKDLKEFKEAYIKDMEKVKNDKEAEKLLKQFKTDLKTFATKKDKIKTYKELVLEQAGDKKAEAEKVLKDYDKKLNEVKSNKELDKLTKEINEKLTEKTGSAISVTTSEVEISTPAVKTYASQATSSGSTASGNSGSKRTSGSSGHVKQRVWVVDKAAWNETVTKYRTETKSKIVYKTSDGKIFNTAREAQAHQGWMVDNTDQTCNWWSENETYTTQIPYTETINHPEEGHWEYR